MLILRYKISKEIFMKILIIGHSVVDHINDEIKPGGIYYSVAGLYNFKNEEDEISLLTSFSEESLIHFQNLYSKINIENSLKVEKVPSVYLKIHKDKEREECYSNLTDKLKINNNIDFNVYDGIYINMVSGFDINLEDLKHIRAKYKGLIYFDVHTFSRGLDENNNRYFRKIPNAKEWLSNIDILQTNENEIFTLSDEKDLHKIINDIFENGIKLLIITKGKNGSSIFYKQNSIIKTINENAVKVKTVNPVGCGDIFGTVFFYSYIKSGNFETALKTANAVAGVCTSYKSFVEFKNIKQDAGRFIN